MHTVSWLIHTLTVTGLFPWVVAGIAIALVLLIWGSWPRSQPEVPVPDLTDPAAYDDTNWRMDETWSASGLNGSERRLSSRRGGSPIVVRVRGYAHRGKDRSATVIDRSTGGLCLALDRDVRPGQVLSVRAMNAPYSTPWVQVEVRNRRSDQRSGSWLVGCRFVERPPWSVLLLFG